MRTFSVCCAAIAFACTGASAASWRPVSQTDTKRFETALGSFVLGADASGDRIAIMLGRVTDNATQGTRVERWQVTTADCLHGRGQLATANVEGRVQYVNRFEFASGSTASRVAQVLCEAYRATLEAPRLQKS